MFALLMPVNGLISVGRFDAATWRRRGIPHGAAEARYEIVSSTDSEWMEVP